MGVIIKKKISKILETAYATGVLFNVSDNEKLFEIINNPACKDTLKKEAFKKFVKNPDEKMMAEIAKNHTLIYEIRAAALERLSSQMLIDVFNAEVASVGSIGLNLKDKIIGMLDEFTLAEVFIAQTDPALKAELIKKIKDTDILADIVSNTSGLSEKLARERLSSLSP